jgi:hypothetical protein
MIQLTDENFLIFAAKHYDNNQCSGTEEFIDDLRRVKYIKKLITRFQQTGELKERLILNHLIILNNVFGAKALAKIVFLKMPRQLPYVKPFLELLGVLPETVHAVNGRDWNTGEIHADPTISEALRKI